MTNLPRRDYLDEAEHIGCDAVHVPGRYAKGILKSFTSHMALGHHMLAMDESGRGLSLAPPEPLATLKGGLDGAGVGA